ITQLINKTNQFNLTTIRRTQDEVETLSNDKNALVLGMTISDKYGDYGLVGVAILKKEGTVAEIDTLLMSCRVLGRGAEETLIAQLAEAAKSLGANMLRGKYIPTPKNSMVAELYPRFGFAKSGAAWELPLHQAPVVPAYVTTALRLHAPHTRKLEATS
ncbi:MAG TPA: methoxymalonyl-ACP biosynthesis protein FkbH, partial [Patescibacteria group bacterium]|nr:methoxymalonyl-ACP biosynthesis protein FkbH [Patescibacteria group bacterium]